MFYVIIKWLKKLTKNINELISLPYTYNVNNTIHLMHDLIDIPYTNNIKLALFDITSMYTNIPANDLTDIIHHLCIYSNTDTTIQTELQNICNIILTQNYFRFNNIQYSQMQGLAMGVPSSSILSEIYLQFLESTRIYDILLRHQIMGYFHYVDNILIVYDNNDTDIHKVLKQFNSISPTLTFAIEPEWNKCIKFLNITIHNDQKISFQIYRKPSRFHSSPRT